MLVLTSWFPCSMRRLVIKLPIIMMRKYIGYNVITNAPAKIKGTTAILPPQKYTSVESKTIEESARINELNKVAIITFLVFNLLLAWFFSAVGPARIKPDEAR